MNEVRNQFGRKSITQKSRKLPLRLDLTALVSISFLLIMFFMLTSYLSRPQAMDLGMPEKKEGFGYVGCCECTYDRSITLLLGKNDEIVTYYGILTFPYETPKKLTYQKNSLRNELETKKKHILELYGNDTRKGPIVLIKPSKESNYKNLVDILDVLAITNVKTYVVVDITPEEQVLLNKNYIKKPSIQNMN